MYERTRSFSGIGGFSLGLERVRDGVLSYPDTKVLEVIKDAMPQISNDPPEAA